MPKISAVICYHQSDEPHLRVLETHLASLCREDLIDLWHRGHLRPGDECDTIVAQKLASADLVLLLVSADFNATYDIALFDTIRRSNSQEQRIVPIPIRPCVWAGHYFFGLQPIPASGEPLTINGVVEESRFCAASHEIRQLVTQMISASSELEVAEDESTLQAPPPLMDTLVASEREIHRLEKTQKEIERLLRAAAEAASIKMQLRPAVITSLIDIERQRQHRVLGNSPPVHQDALISSLRRFRSALASAAQLDLDSCAPAQMIDCASEFFERLFHSKQPTPQTWVGSQTTSLQRPKFDTSGPIDTKMLSHDGSRSKQQSQQADAPILNEERLRRAYNAYLDAKRSVGESTAGLTFKAFSLTLGDHARRLRAANPTKMVDYRVVLKDGKPVLAPILIEMHESTVPTQDAPSVVDPKAVEP